MIGVESHKPRPYRLPIGTALLSVLAVAATGHSSLGTQLEDARNLLVTFEWWRPITGHLAHAGALHLFLNLAVFIPLGAFRESRVGTRQFLLELLALAASVAAGIRFLHGEWDTYRGLSGVVYGLLIVLLLDTTRKYPGDESGVARARSRLGLVAFLTGKSALEYGGDGWLVATGWFESSLGVTYLPGSHCAGIAGGTAIAVLAAIKNGKHCRTGFRVEKNLEHEHSPAFLTDTVARCRRSWSGKKGATYGAVAGGW